MVHKVTLTPLDGVSTLRAQSPQSGYPAQVWLARKVSEFDDFWPRTQKSNEAHCYAFQCADILDVRCNTIAQARNVEPLFAAVVDSNDAPLLLLALGIEHRHGIRVLTFLDGGLSDYNAPVAFPATRNWDANHVRIIWGGLLHILPSFDIALLDRMPEQIGDLPNPLIHLSTSQFGSSGHASTLSGTWKDFAATRVSRRHTHRRYRRRLEERGPLRFEIAQTPQEFDSLLAVLIRQKIRHHRETLTVAGFERPGYHDFVAELTYSLPPASTIHLSALKVGDTVVAVHWGYVVGRRFYYMISSYEAGEWSRYAPGRLLLEHLLEWCFTQEIEIFDFGFGDEEYKSEYSDLIIGLHVAQIPVTAKGAAYSLVHKTIEEIKRNIRHTQVGSALKFLLRGARGRHKISAP